MDQPKLFHALVVMGAALTGGTAVATSGCSSDPSTCNPQYDSTCGEYAHIQAVPCDAASGNCYHHIAADASGDGYAHISVPPVDAAPVDGYAHISVDSSPPPDAPTDGAGEAG
jgi:hypothetical protein